MDTVASTFIDSIRKIKKENWDSLFGDIPESYEFFEALENSRLEGFSFYYFLIFFKNAPVLIAPLFTTRFDLSIVLEEPFLNIVGLIRKIIPNFLITNTLFCGSPFGENGILGIKNDVAAHTPLIKEMAEKLVLFGKKNKIPLFILKDYMEEKSSLLNPLVRKYGFFKTESFPSVTIELEFRSFEEYLKSLSYATRKNLRRKLKNTKADIEVKISDNATYLIDQIYSLYLNTYNSGKTKFEKLSKEFFLRISDFEPHTKFFLYYIHGQLAAFNLCFVYDTLMIDKFIGFDYSLSKKYNLYFFSWCFNIEWCINNGIRYYQVGQTDYSPKIKLGGKLIPLYAYVKHANPLFHRILKFMANLPKSYMAQNHTTTVTTGAPTVTYYTQKHDEKE